MQNQLTLPALLRCILKPHHALLRKELERAADLTSSVVVEQRPPLCRILLPLYRLFSEFRGDLAEHLDLQDTRLFPRLLELEVALRDGDWPLGSAEDVAEVLRLLQYGHIGLTRLLDEMRELTHGFIAPPGACECYGELLDVLAGIQMEIASEIRMESTMLFPQAHDLVERVRHSTVHAHVAAMVM